MLSPGAMGGSLSLGAMGGSSGKSCTRQAVQNDDDNDVVQEQADTDEQQSDQEPNDAKADDAKEKEKQGAVSPMTPRPTPAWGRSILAGGDRGGPTASSELRMVDEGRLEEVMAGRRERGHVVD